MPQTLEGSVTEEGGTKEDGAGPGGTETDGQNVKMDPAVANQVDYIKREFTDPQIDYVPFGNGVEFMYAVDQILVREEWLERVQRLLGLPVGFNGQPPPKPVVVHPAAGPRNVEPVVPGVVLLRLHGMPVREALDTVDEHFGEDVAAPDHVLTVAGSQPIGGPCPATEPEPAYYDTEPSPGICTQNSGAGVLVYIADTGLLEESVASHSWLEGVERARRRDGHYQDWEKRTKLYMGRPVIAPYAGHGTFVAGVVRCMAPEAAVIVSDVFKTAGTALESHFVRDLNRALALGVDVFNLSVTAPTRKYRPLLAFGAWLKVLAQYKGTVCVVAAGNQGNSRPHWPAAFPGMVSVGALGTGSRDRARFSNHGGWVDVYAPGRDLVNAYTHGTYVCRHAPYRDQEREFHGMARWSGTSFSTPVVTGLVAARMSVTGENGQEAAAALLAQARAQAIPGLGAVLLSCCCGGGVVAGCPGPGGCCCGRNDPVRCAAGGRSRN
jgi:subtilisin family serine protease